MKEKWRINIEMIKTFRNYSQELSLPSKSLKYTMINSPYYFCNLCINCSLISLKKLYDFYQKKWMVTIKVYAMIHEPFMNYRSNRKLVWNQFITIDLKNKIDVLYKTIKVVQHYLLILYIKNL